MSVAIVPIVEGQAEVESIPVLLRRVVSSMGGTYEVQVARPFRVKRNRVVKQGELERTVQQAIRDRGHAGCILVILDADDDCPAGLAPSLRKRCQQVTQLPVAVVIANKELEGWFLGAKESLRGVRGIGQLVLVAGPNSPLGKAAPSSLNVRRTPPMQRRGVYNFH